MAIITCSICHEQNKQGTNISGGSVCVDCAETLGSKQLYITCLNCGNKWKAGKQK